VFAAGKASPARRIYVAGVLNGRLDLTQAESIADLVELDPKAAQTALAGLQGKLAHPIRQLRHLDILAEIKPRLILKTYPVGAKSS